MTVDWGKVFDNYGVKQVSPNDKSKAAYVPSRQQVRTIEAAGISPRKGVSFEITILHDPILQKVDSSYYHAERSDEAHRTPEPRMGRGFISSWLNPGDEVLIGNIGTEIFAMKLGASPSSDEDAASEIATKAKRKTIFDRAKKSIGKPAKRTIQRDDFVRNPYVIQAALLRANGKCEVPSCVSPLFAKENGSAYLEVHHVHMLGEGGDDTIENVAALCPKCHRELHHGKDRSQLRASLAAHILTLPKS